MRKWPELEIMDYVPGNFSIPFAEEGKLRQLNSPVIMLGRGGGGTRLLGTLTYDLGVFMGNRLNPSMDCMDMVMPVYQGIVEKYCCFTDWQKSQTVMRLRVAAARMIEDIPHDSVWGFKIPESILLLPELDEAFPDARYVNYVRDPLATCLRRPHMTARLDNHIGRIALPLAYDYLDIARSQILEDSPAYHMAYTTLHQLELVSVHLKKIARERLFETSFEELLVRPAEELLRMGRWLGLRRKFTSLEDLIEPGRASNPTEKYSDDVAKQVEKLLRKIRVQMGYVKNPTNYPERLAMLLKNLRGRWR